MNLDFSEDLKLSKHQNVGLCILLSALLLAISPPEASHSPGSHAHRRFYPHPPKWGAEPNSVGVSSAPRIPTGTNGGGHATTQVSPIRVDRRTCLETCPSPGGTFALGRQPVPQPFLGRDGGRRAGTRHSREKAGQGAQVGT